MSGRPVGIDLGTYNSAVAYVAPDGEVHMAQSDYGPTSQGRVFPSFVKFNALGRPLSFGETARRDTSAPQQVVWGVKRLIGKGYQQVEADLDKFLYRVEKGPEGKGLLIPQGQKKYTPTEVSALILGWVKECIEDKGLNPFVGSPVDRAVVTHPAYFDSVEISETRKAAEKAGFANIDLISEPIAAALSYGLQLDAGEKPYVMVIDWGAGTLDIVIVRLMLDSERGIPIIPEAIPAHGNLRLGGIDMDDAVVNWVIQSQNLEDLAELQDRLREGLPVAADNENVLAALRSLMKLREEAEQAKIDLSSSKSVTKHFPYQSQDRSFTITSKDLEKMLEAQLAKCRRHIEWMIKEASFAPKDIKHLLLVGGPMKMPCVRSTIAEVFSSNREVTGQLRRIEKEGFPADPMECVARGAALRAHQLWGQGGRADIDLGRKIADFDYGILLENRVGEILVHKEAVLPAQGSFDLSAPVPLGGSLSVSLYKVEVDPESETFKDRYVHRGDYGFYPAPDSTGMAAFHAELKLGDSKLLTATFIDLHTQSELELIEVDADWKVIPKPREPGVRDNGDGEEEEEPPDEKKKKKKERVKPPPVLTHVSQETAQMARRRAMGHLQLAKGKVMSSGVSSKTRSLIENECAELDKALQAMPRSGPVPYKKFQDVEHRSERVRNRLDFSGLLTHEEEQ